MGKSLTAWAASPGPQASWFASSKSQGIFNFALGQSTTTTVHILERILGESQCAAELGLERCVWALPLASMPKGALL